MYDFISLCYKTLSETETTPETSSTLNSRDIDEIRDRDISNTSELPEITCECTLSSYFAFLHDTSLRLIDLRYLYNIIIVYSKHITHARTHPRTHAHTPPWLSGYRCSLGWWRPTVTPVPLATMAVSAFYVFFAYKIIARQN